MALITKLPLVARLALRAVGQPAESELAKRRPAGARVRFKVAISGLELHSGRAEWHWEAVHLRQARCSKRLVKDKRARELLNKRQMSYCLASARVASKRR